MLAVFGVLVVSVKRFPSAMVPSPNFGGALHPPRDGSSHSCQPSPQIDDSLIHGCWHVVLHVFSPLMSCTILQMKPERNGDFDSLMYAMIFTQQHYPATAML